MKKLLLLFVLPGLIAASELTNADVVKMSDAKLDESIILTAIENAEPHFDVSPTGLIELSNAQISQTVISAMIKRANASEKLAAPASETGTEARLMSPSEVFLLNGEQTTPMRYLTPQTRTAARGLGFGGIASYAVLRGFRANERITIPSPSFLVSVPNQAQPESYVTLASFAVRKNNSREVLIGGGYMSYSSGIHPDRIIAVSTEKADDQTKAQQGFTIYKITPRHPLRPGEYAIILYTGEMQGLVGAWFAGGGNSFFDFGVDP